MMAIKQAIKPIMAIKKQADFIIKEWVAVKFIAFAFDNWLKLSQPTEPTEPIEPIELVMPTKPIMPRSFLGSWLRLREGA